MLLPEVVPLALQGKVDPFGDMPSGSSVHVYSIKLEILGVGQWDSPG